MRKFECSVAPQSRKRDKINEDAGANIKNKIRRGGIITVASDTQQVDVASIPSSCHTVDCKNGIPSFPAWRSARKQWWEEKAGKLACCDIG